MAKGSQASGFDPLALLYLAVVFASALLVPAVLSRCRREFACETVVASRSDCPHASDEPRESPAAVR